MDAEEAKVLAEVAKAVPAGAWERAISIVESLASPATATTSGIGQLIKNTVDCFSELQKLNTAAVIEQARAKIEEAKKPLAVEIEAKVIVPTLEGASVGIGSQFARTLGEFASAGIYGWRRSSTVSENPFSTQRGRRAGACRFFQGSRASLPFLSELARG